jgi:hypothetical protein
MTSSETALFISWQGLVICAAVTIAYNFIIRGLRNMKHAFLKHNKTRRELQ